nr:reverse transcriptase [Tanacetum cinerariifolium]GEY01913.1 reverse transcriptase [Tanacetum cinerariifolium]
STRNSNPSTSNGTPLILDDETKRMPKIEFPKFSGDDVKGWVFRRGQFFLLERTLDLDKVTLISIHLYDKALLWYSQFVRTDGTNVTWEVYKKTILARFCNVYEDPMSELKNLKYETTAREYKGAFDSLLSRVEISKDHVISLFMGGLPTEIEMGVRIGQLYSLVLVLEIESEGNFLEIDESVVNNGLMDLQEPLISLNALTSTNNFKTMRVLGIVGKHLLHIFIDCGSTHNFLDRNMAKKLGCNIKVTCPLSVTVADENKLVTTSECKQFKWQVGLHHFSTDAMLLPLEGCDMQVIADYEDVYAIPTELPPKRDHDHTILLIEGTQLVNIRPYRHPPSQKDAIEDMVAELLAA